MIEIKPDIENMKVLFEYSIRFSECLKVKKNVESIKIKNPAETGLPFGGGSLYCYFLRGNLIIKTIELPQRKRPNHAKTL